MRMGFLSKKASLEASDLKQVIVMRADLKLPKGKAAAQVAHASVEAVLRSSDTLVEPWHASGMKKIVLKVADEKALIELFGKAQRAGLIASLITDAGKTVVAPGTKTCIGIGPDDEGKIDAVTGDLQML